MLNTISRFNPFSRGWSPPSVVLFGWHTQTSVRNSGRPDLAQRESAWLVLSLLWYWSLRYPSLSLFLALFSTTRNVVVCQQSCQTRAEVVHFSALRFRSTRCQQSFSPTLFHPPHLSLSNLLFRYVHLLFPSFPFFHLSRPLFPSQHLSRAFPFSVLLPFSTPFLSLLIEHALVIPLSTPPQGTCNRVSSCLSWILRGCRWLLSLFVDAYNDGVHAPIARPEFNSFVNFSPTSRDAFLPEAR